jgi:hypothetical protein
MQHFTKFFSIRTVGRLRGCDLFFILDGVNYCNRQSVLLLTLTVFNISAKFSPIGSFPNYCTLLSCYDDEAMWRAGLQRGVPRGLC